MEFIYHALGICGESHANIYHFLAVGGLIYAIQKINFIRRRKKEGQVYESDVCVNQ